MSNNNHILIFIYLITLINSKILADDYCQKIQCYSDLTPGTCIKAEPKISLFNPCPDSKFCNVSSLDPMMDSTCIDQKNNFDFKKLPSLPCKENSECISNKCSSNVCQGVSDNQKCTAPSDCNYGKTCRKDSNDNNIYKCLDPLKKDEKCEIDTDCEIGYGCSKGICTEYFSLENWEKTGGRDYGNDLNFCKSGYVNEIGVCMNIYLKNEVTECSDNSPCEYEYKDENNEQKSIIIHQNCLCGYNPFGKKYCLIGSGNTNYTRYLNKLKDYYMNNTNCHLSERSSEGCQKDIISGSPEKLLQIQELINSKYWATANNRLIDAPDCIYSIELPEYNRSLDKNTLPEPIPEGKCAKYNCAQSIKGGTCALSDFKNMLNINITLADVCENNVKCNLDGDPNDIFYNGTNIEAKCSNLNNKRYPGEKCSIDSECVYPLNNPSTQFHKCEENLCTGIEEDGICEDNSWCLVGYYCDKGEGKCKSQKGEDKSCSESKECKNDLICNGGKCKELFSLNDGDSVPEYESYEFQKMFCKNMEVIDNKCVSFNDINNNYANEGEYKKCDFNDLCVYKVNGLESWRKKYERCGCGYNANGQGYCPKYHDYNKDDWDEYREILKDKSDNKCHTESRFHCYEFDEEEESKLKEYKNKLEKGHLFYGCVDCAKKVLAGNYISIYTFGYLFISLFIFLF